jgi:hypothetical protein
MPLAIAKPLREQIVSRHQQGESLTSIAHDLRLSYRTTRGLWERYQRLGESGLEANYDKCGRPGPRFPSEVCEKVLALKREHTRWGAQLVRIELRRDRSKGQQEKEALPSERTINRWVKAAGLQPLRGRQPRTKRDRGGKPHEVWQLDAKERIRLGSGEQCSQLSIVDENSGANLVAEPFPPRALGARERE